VKALASFLYCEIGGISMDIGVLSIIISQSRVQQSVGIEVMKMAMNTGKENATQITEIMENVAVDPNLGKHIDFSE
jgi:hypothetical protein